MAKFKPGMKFRHDNTSDTDIVVISVDSEKPNYVTLTVMYVSQWTDKPRLQKNGSPLGRQQITIKDVDYDKWKHVVEKV